MGKGKKLIKLVSGKVVHLDTLRVSASERLNLQRLDAEVRAANAEYARKQMEAEAFIKSIDPEGKYHRLVGEAMTAQGTVQRFVQENNALIDSVSKRLGIDLRKHSIDTETGVVHELGGPEVADVLDHAPKRK